MTAWMFSFSSDTVPFLCMQRGNCWDFDDGMFMRSRTDLGAAGDDVGEVSASVAGFSGQLVMSCMQELWSKSVKWTLDSS